MSDEELQALVRKYGNEQNDVRYLEFLEDSNPYAGMEIGEKTKAQYQREDIDFSGVSEVQKLLFKIKTIVKKDRIRLGEFFQDHDVLRKGILPAQKFRGVLHSQKIELTNEEYERLERYFQYAGDKTKVDYVNFNEEVEKIFTEKGLEKDPLKRLTSFNPPSILDPKDVLNDSEEQIVHNALLRIGLEVRNRRLLIKPFFQDKDRSNSGFIATSRFRSIFDTMKLYIQDHEFELICKRFQAKAVNEVNYVEFDHVLKIYSGDNLPQ